MSRGKESLPGGDGGVGCENVGRRDDLQRRIKIEFLVDNSSADPFQREKRRVAFVHVEDFRLDPKRVERFDPADPEHDLLAHPHFLIAAVKLRGDQAIFGVVFRKCRCREGTD